MRALKRLIFTGWALLSVAGVCGASAPRNSDGRHFVHPGIFYTQGDFDRMRAMVAAGREPWTRAFNGLKASPYANPNAGARPRGGKIEEGTFNQTIGIDGRRAHDLALMWKLTDDARYADRARDFLVQNANWTETSGRGTAPLDNGKIHLLIEAAELLRDYPGWKAEDQARFKRMLREVFYPHIRTGDWARWGNQGLTAYHAVLAMAVYLDDAKMYDRVWNYLLGLPHRADDAPYTSGGAWSPDWPADYGETCITRTKPPVVGTEPDWGYDEQLRYYIYANGQGEEACRDQPHALYGLFKMVSLAEIFWNQGDDLYGALDNRILTGCEWALRYNLSDWEPTGYTNEEAAVTFANGRFYQTKTRNNRWTALKPSPHGRGTDGGPAAPRTAALMHYTVRRGLSPDKAVWLRKAVDRTLAHDGKNDGFESWGFPPNWFYEWEGWGTLTKTRTPWQKGDPGTWQKDGRRVSGAHAVPGTIKVSDFDFLPGRKGPTRDYTLSVPEKGRYQLRFTFRAKKPFVLQVWVDGRSVAGKRLAAPRGTQTVDLGVITLPAGAPVLQLSTPDGSLDPQATLTLVPVLNAETPASWLVPASAWQVEEATGKLTLTPPAGSQPPVFKPVTRDRLGTSVILNQPFPEPSVMQPPRED